MNPSWNSLCVGGAFLLGGALAALPARAQILNTEPLFRADTEAPHALTTSGTVSGARGNTDVFLLGLDLAGRTRKDDVEFLLFGLHSRQSASDALVANRSVAHLRSRYYLSEAVQAEVYGQVAQDRFRLMTHRFVAGVGPRFVPIRMDAFTWTFAFSHMYEVERLDDSVDFPGGLTRKRHRLNIMSAARLELEKITLAQTFYLQPAWADPENIRVLHLLTAQVAISEYLSLTWSLDQALDTIAPSDVSPLDVRFNGGLKFDL